MSLKGKQARRALAAVGSACFLGGLLATASQVDAGAYLTLKPVDGGGISAGSGVGHYSGDDFTGYTLTLATGSTTTFSYDAVVHLTSGATTGAADPTANISRLQGAVRVTNSANVSVSHNTYTVNLSEDETTGGPPITFNNAMNGTQGSMTLLVNPASQSFGTLYSFKAGVASGQGVGPQAAGYSSAVNTGVSNTRVEANYATPVVAANGVSTVRGSVTVIGTGATTSDVASLLWADGQGNVTEGSGGTEFQSWLTWSDVGQANGTYTSSGVSADDHKFGLNIIYINAVTLVKGDFGGNEDASMGFNLQDGNFDDLDIEGFFLALNNPSLYLSLNPTLVAADLITLGDFGGNEDLAMGFNAPDGAFDDLDIEGFFFALNDPAGYAAIQPPPRGGRGPGAVPEPSALAFLAPLGIALSRRRR